MAKKSVKPDRGHFGGYRFLSVYLSEVDAERLEALVSNDEIGIGYLFDLVHEGYKFSCNEDAKNSSFVASLTDTRPGSVAHKCILTGRGSTATDACYALVYKHHYILEGDWTGLVGEKTDTPSRFS